MKWEKCGLLEEQEVGKYRRWEEGKREWHDTSDQKGEMRKVGYLKERGWR